MAVVESSRNRHKAFLGFLKVLPIVMAGLFFTNTVLSYLGYDLLIISYTASVGFIPWLFIMAASYLFHFCEYHRVFLWYIMANNIICWTDSEYRLPISNWDYFVLHVIIAGLSLFLFIYLRHKICKHSKN